MPVSMKEIAMNISFVGIMPTHGSSYLSCTKRGRVWERKREREQEQKKDEPELELGVREATP